MLGCSGWEPVIVYVTLASEVWNLISSLQLCSLLRLLGTERDWPVGGAQAPPCARSPSTFAKHNPFMSGLNPSRFILKERIIGCLVNVSAQRSVFLEKNKQDCMTPVEQAWYFWNTSFGERENRTLDAFSSWWNVEGNGLSRPGLDTWVEAWQPWAGNAYTLWASGWGKLEGCLPLGPANLKNSIAAWSPSSVAGCLQGHLRRRPGLAESGLAVTVQLFLGVLRSTLCAYHLCVFCLITSLYHPVC